MHDLGDLRVVVAVHIEKNDAIALFEWQAVQSTGQRPGPLQVQGLGFRLFIPAGGRLPRLVLEIGIRLARPAAARALQVHRAVDGYPAQPAADAAAPERGQVLVGAEERFLDDVGGVVPIRHQPIYEGVEMVLMTRDDLVERIEAAPQRILDEGHVDALAECVGPTLLVRLHADRCLPVSHSLPANPLAHCASRPVRGGARIARARAQPCSNAAGRHPRTPQAVPCPPDRADVAELAYALDSKSSGREVMRVQLPPSAPIPYPRLDNARFVLRSGLAAVSFDRFEPQFGGDGNTHGNTRNATPGCSLDSVMLTAQAGRQWPRQ